jgi:hypothetical protein
VSAAAVAAVATITSANATMRPKGMVRIIRTHAVTH